MKRCYSVKYKKVDGTIDMIEVYSGIRGKTVYADIRAKIGEDAIILKIIEL